MGSRVADEECRRPSPSAPASGGMSVFGDFQRVWVQRFPDSALPAAWEEDVRANLVKHKQKVSPNATTPPPGGTRGARSAGTD